MKKAFIIFKKEITDTLRDRRTIIMMIVIPLLVFPLIMNLVVRIGSSQKAKAEERILKVGLVTQGNAAQLKESFLERADMTINQEVDMENIEKLVQEKKFDFVIVLAADFDQRIKDNQSGQLDLYYKTSSENEIGKRRILKIINSYRKDLVDHRLSGLNLDSSFITPLNIADHDLSSLQEKFGEYAGGFLPYFFVIFCFMGAMYPAIDLAAGEKERATIETLLATPATRLQIVMGKFLVVTLAGIISAAISIFGLYVAVKQTDKIPAKILDVIQNIVEWQSIALLLSLLIPLCVFFAAVLLSLSIYARSFKEAQSIMTPMNLIVILPAAIGIMPGIKLDLTTAMIPILNVSLASREIIAGTIKLGLLLEVYASLFLLAGVSLYFCVRWFNREEVIFRGN